MNTITIGGKAGHGVKAAGKLISKVLNELGYNFFVLNDYPSIISGGHNFCKVSFNEKEIYSYYKETDVILALDKKTIEIHKKDLKKQGVVLFDKNYFQISKKDYFGTPAKDFVDESKGIDIMRNTALLGSLAFVVGIDFNVLKNVLEKTYPSKSKLNVEIAEKGYNYAKENFKQVFKLKKIGKPKRFMCGNSSISEGSVEAGLNNYFAYPMTPATSILHYLAQRKKELNLKVVQPENEISVIMMALGSSYAGAKTMVGTSGGGFALMSEAISLAGMSENPLVIVESQRAGASTGVPTYTQQADLNFVLHAGHGDFPKVVVAPGTHEDAYYKSAEALQIAWKYQLPVIILVDKHLSENFRNVEFNKKINKFKFKISKGGANYKRYSFVKDGISPIAFPGMKNTIVKSTSYEHDEYGISIEDSEKVKKMHDKRIDKIKTLNKEIEKLKTVKVYGKGKNVILTWGSTVGAAIEAAKELKNTKVVQVLYMLPFPSKEVKKHLSKSKKIACVEANATGQFADLVELKTKIKINNRILKYDSRQFEPIELRKELKRWFK